MIYLTFSQRKFIKETIEILSIFCPEVKTLIKEKIKEIKKLDKNKFQKGEIFFSYIFSLRYPVLNKKLAALKNYKVPWNLEFDEDNYSFKDEIKNIINQL
ncbi:MAG: hypothetical protein N2323_07155 [candidate division WOR-3 bacterium]|nr:hypothetical protein [candidate division WOR-3 bacterium]MCX7837701.1 hypothetical protein [candidate division WOR-3 bacterium]MDW8114110.1 hypothetical protein [candidate division WOR-3 bacterium]